MQEQEPRRNLTQLLDELAGLDETQRFAVLSGLVADGELTIEMATQITGAFMWVEDDYLRHANFEEQFRDILGNSSEDPTKSA